jgi:hypothetical protein
MMSHIEERTAVACPLAQAAARIRRFFRENGPPSGDTTQLDLRVDIALPGIGSLLELQRSVVVTLQEHHLPGDETPRYRIQWATRVPGPFPLFAGELRVDEWTDYDSFSLRLEGDYEPPLGIAGEAFDIVLGKRIAHVTAVDLLARIRTAIERDFSRDEAAKPHATRIVEP